MTSTFARTETTAAPQVEQEFNSRNCWYPVTFSQDLPHDRPYGFSLYDEPLVLFRNSQGDLVCLQDLCPHRAAKLSDGQIIDGKIECLYHGWQFGSGGECSHIPQLTKDAKIPERACIKSYPVVECQGMVWIWAGEAQDAREELIPTLADLDRAEFVTADKMHEYPCDQFRVIENLLDPAHLEILHDGSQGKKENAQPLEMEILKSSIEGIKGRWRGMQKKDSEWINIDFFAPNLVFLKVNIKEDKGWSLGLAIYSLPLGKNRCRIIIRGYRNFFTWQIKLVPRWFDHMNKCQISEEDIIVLARQQEITERLGKNLEQIYLPLRTCDLLVIEYRKWLDRFGSSLPYYQGYSTSKTAENNLEPNSEIVDRFEQHTKICSSCNRAYRVSKQVRYIEPIWDLWRRGNLVSGFCPPTYQ